ncbi:MAG: hypothetical protein M3O64_06735 [Chloroflexota bacterium]|nr:hypothetical protein [Chloroflexota bacterium]
MALVAVPFGAGLLVVAAVGPSLAEADRIGLMAVAIAPALLVAPALAGAIGGRMDRTGALVIGSIAAWLVLALTRGGTAAGVAQTTMLPFLIGAGVTSAVPMLPAMLRTAAQRLGDVAFLVLAAIAISSAGALQSANGLAALALFAAIAGSAAIVGRIGGVDLGSALAGAGSRDPAVATGLAVALGGGPAIPLYSGILLLALSAGLAARNRRKAR